MTLKPEDFRNPMFDRQKVVKRKVRAREGIRGDDDEGEDDDLDGFDAEGVPKERRETVIEGTTVTDDFNEVGFTYYLSDGMLTVVNPRNEKLFVGTIGTPEDFERALKKADKKQRRLLR